MVYIGDNNGENKLAMVEDLSLNQEGKDDGSNNNITYGLIIIIMIIIMILLICNPYHNWRMIWRELYLFGGSIVASFNSWVCEILKTSEREAQSIGDMVLFAIDNF